MDRQFVFSGLLNEDVNDFLLEFERLSKLKKWSESEQPFALASYLSGAALEFYRYWVATKDGSYGELISAFKNEFKPSINYYLLLANADMSKFNTVWEYIYSTINLAYKANNNMVETEIIQFILKGMTPPLRDRLVTQVYRNLNDLKSVIRQMESIYGNIIKMKDFQIKEVSPNARMEEQEKYTGPLQLENVSGDGFNNNNNYRNSYGSRDVMNRRDSHTNYPNTRSRSLRARRGR